ncbi:hypothetical protein D4764_11G0000460 [Takifugu flavidus]|uniref:SGNH hydrolase-type esterase domain-containing protein n=1 Tax=Takifugu flavidus TaxID=433684 RepID=A0A5C6PF01_9TELE|nr:hypothetical protein D4764_11G0000460 [Takifugu flavidus]
MQDVFHSCYYASALDNLTSTGAPSTSFLRPTESQGFIAGDGAGALVSSTPLKPREPWSVVARGAGARPSPPPLPPYLPLDNSWLSPDEEPGSARSTWPPATILVRSNTRPAPPSPGSSPPPPHLQTVRGGPQVQRTPAVLVVGTSVVRHVAVHDGRTFCHPGAPRVVEVTSSALQLSAQHPSASTLVLEAGINDLKFQQSEVLKQDFISLVDRLLDTGKRLIISGPLPPPRYGDVITSRPCG